ncbi:MAG: molybdopterin-dependent oxidoreductase [Caldiserica bacterium]|jgi:CO/xanthine dehydrogenase Mo-binding subunit/aerobic-type carbon monoxide dehydrogenase small subunit (CoxS/CutS family)|nr:molybdopterin-dependent oxidoreductase [Caldisericota bacterium]
MKRISFTLNGKMTTVEFNSGARAIDVLRERLGLTGTKEGCGRGECGACTILLNGEPVASCLLLADKLEGQNVQTIEGLSFEGSLHPLQESFLKEGAVQCGFCTPGIILSAKSLLDRKKSPEEAEILEALTGNLCRCTGYNKIVKAVQEAAMGQEGLRNKETFGDDSFIGKRIPKKDGYELVTGKAKFAGDLVFPGMVFAVKKAAGVPSGFLKKLDVEKAKKCDGVLAVILPSDIPGPNKIGVLPPYDQPLLVTDQIRYQGDGLALVVAETREQAEKATSLIEVEIEPIEPILEPEDALNQDDRKIHPEGNLIFKRRLVKGNIEDGFKESDVILETEYRSSIQEHAYLEPEAVVVVPENDGRITVYASCQSPFHLRLHIAANLGLPASKVRVLQPFVGGSFGGKDDVATEMGCLAGVAALKLMRPVKMVHTREEVMTQANVRHPSIIRIKTGAKRDGTLVARKIEIVLDGGAYASESPFVVMKTLIHAAGPYRIPNLDVTSMAVYTNKIYSGAMRGFGVPQVTFASEAQVDELARKLGIDRLRIRKQNALRPGDQNATGQVFDSSVGLIETINKVEDEVKWPAPLEDAKGYKNQRYRRGVGIACLLQGISNGAEGIDVTSASVQMIQDGSAVINVGLSEMGQGSRTVYAQIAAEVLGLSIDNVTVRQVDTDLVHDSGVTVASRSTATCGKAVEMASMAVRDSLAKMASLMLKTDPSKIVFKEDFAWSIENPSVRIPISQVATAAYWTGFPLMNLAIYKAPESRYDHETHQGDIYIAYNYGTHFMEVEVDVWTGKVKVIRHIACHDVGKIINRLGVEGQVEGASLMGLGFAHLEELVVKNGLVANPNFSDYWIPTIKDRIPTKALFVEDPNPNGPFGAKGIGEPPLAGAAAAFVNAVSDAIGLPVRQIPLKPEVILESFISKEGGEFND